MQSFVDVITRFGGAAKFAAAIGVKPFHAQTMKARRSIPPAYWSRLVEAAAREGVEGISYEMLSRLAEKRADREAAA